MRASGELFYKAAKTPSGPVPLPLQNTELPPCSRVALRTACPHTLSLHTSVPAEGLQGSPSIPPFPEPCVCMSLPLPDFHFRVWTPEAQSSSVSHPVSNSGLSPTRPPSQHTDTNNYHTSQGTPSYAGRVPLRRDGRPKSQLTVASGK